MAVDKALLAPHGEVVEIHINAAAAGADASGGYAKAPFDGVVSAVTIIPATTLTGANTDSRTIQLFNRAQDGLGATKVAEKAFVAGVNAPTDDETTITVITAAAANAVAKDDILEAFSLHVGATGLAGPDFTMFVTFSGTGAP